MRTIAFAFLTFWSIACQAQQVFSFTNAPGEHHVGLHVVEQYDNSRTFPASGGTGPRPIQTLVWYPVGESKGGEPMRFEDYLLTIGGADDFSRTPAQRRKVADEDIDGKTEGKRAAQIAVAKTQAMWAVREAPAASGKFPVVIYAPSFSGDAFQNADLCEYLASHGYVVIASPSLGPAKRGMSLDLKGIDAQVGDIRFLIDYAGTLPQADTSKIAVIGYSTGGLSNVFAAARDKRITTLVELDGSVRYFNKLVVQAGDVTPDRMKVPMLYLAQRSPSIETIIKYKQDLSGSFINEMKSADLYLFNINGLDHSSFSSWFIRLRDPGTFEDYSAEEVSAAYGWMARYVLAFLNAYTKSDANEKAFLSARPEKNGVTKHLIEKAIEQQLSPQS